MLLQERIEELGSGILNYNKDKVELIGFMSKERLLDYYDKGIQCFSSHGFYSIEDLDFAKIKDNALFIINKDNKVERYCFEVLKKDSVQYKDENKKTLSKVYSIRKSEFNDIYNFKETDFSVLFNGIDELRNYFRNRFNDELVLE